MPRITHISGPVVRVALEEYAAGLYEIAYVGAMGLVAETVEVTREEAVLQVFEASEGLRLGEPVRFGGSMFSVRLGPGLLGSVFDGIQRPLERLGTIIARGTSVPPLDREKRWAFRPLKKEGDALGGGEYFAEVSEGELTHRLMLPFSRSGTVRFIAPEGEYTSEETVLRLDDGFETGMIQEVPLRIPRPFKTRLSPDQPLLTGQRIIDFLFPMARGGSASIPGGFGTGKTILQQTLAKWCDADVIIYVGCGERGNEMTEVLEEFPRLRDPRSGRPLMERTVLIANTSDMPVSARGASILLGLAIGEYYRDMGYHVALMADSTSRWAEAMREISGRMNELPAEEGFPAYLASRIAAVYERAAIVETLGGPRGSVSIIGAVSPPGGDLSEPVTRNTRRYTSAFWSLDRELASARFFPAINDTASYSAYGKTLERWWKNTDEESGDLRQWMLGLLREDASLQKIVKLLGTEALPEHQKLTVETAALVREVFLQQDAFDPVDAFSSPERIVWMARLLREIHRLWLLGLEQGRIPVEVLRGEALISEFIRSKFEIDNAGAERYYSELQTQLRKRYEILLETYTREGEE